MSRKRGVQHSRRPHRHSHHPQLGADRFAMVAAWCLTEADLPDAKARTHDTLIARMGDRRTSPVRWVMATGAKAQALLTEMIGGTDEEADGTSVPIDADYQHISQLLDTQGGILVLAVASGRD